jgi:hypothetical protein
MSVEIIRSAVPRSLCLAAEAAWPGPDWPFWHRYQGTTGDKFGSMDRARIPAACLAALDALALRVLRLIGGSFIDYDLHAAGMHMMPPGGFLGRHLDAECHPIRPWKRTHSIVMGVNSGWGELCGGKLILEGIGEFPVQEPGTAIVFETPGQWHEVTRVNTDVSLLHRKTLALFAWQQDSDCHGSSAANFQMQMSTGSKTP